mgnify:CR=1 FL=1
MAKESLTAFLNREIKKKGTSLKEEKAKASKYSSISAAKKAGSLYYTNKKGVVMAAVYAEDLKEKLGAGKQSAPITSKSLNDKPGARDERKPDPSNLAGKGGRGTGLNLKMPRMGVRKNKGGMMKKKTGYAAGGMPMVMKNGKKVPAYAADGVGKMNVGGMAKKKPAAKMMAGGMAKKKPAAKMMAGGMTKKKPAAKMMAGGMSKKSGYMYGGMAKKKPAAKKK